MARSRGERHARAKRLYRLSNKENHLGDPHLRVAARFFFLQLVDDPREKQDGQRDRVGDLAARLHGAIEHFQHLPEIRRTLIANGVVHLGQKRFEQRRLDQQTHGVARPAAAKQLQNFFRHARWRRFQNLAAMTNDGVVCGRLDGEVESRCELDRPHHPHRIFAKAHIGIADHAHAMLREVVESADVVDHREVGDVVEERVDREVATTRILQR